jgi:hypothetical protein
MRSQQREAQSQLSLTKENDMKPALIKLPMVMGIVLLGVVFTGTAFAGCGEAAKLQHGALVPQSWSGESGFLLPISDDSSNDPITGMWHATFTAMGNEMGPPDNTPIDNALVVFHSDGTEIMNSARPPQDGNFCLGVWKKVGKSRYKVNHIPWFSNDTTNAPSGIGNPSGPTRIFQNFVLSPDGKHYTGTFSLDAYDTAGNQVAHIVGVVNATRVNINTTVPDLL